MCMYIMYLVSMSSSSRVGGNNTLYLNGTWFSPFVTKCGLPKMQYIDMTKYIRVKNNLDTLSTFYLLSYCSKVNSG